VYGSRHRLVESDTGRRPGDRWNVGGVEVASNVAISIGAAR